MPLVCVFDLNDTLLDFGALDPLFEKAFGGPGARKLWFKQVLHTACVLTLTETYREFSEICEVSLETIAQSLGAPLHSRMKKDILDSLGRLPLYGDVRDGLGLLKEGGVRIAALTQSSARRALEQVRQAGASDFFERIFSTDSVRRFKPAPEAYHFAAKHLGVPIQKVRLVTSHPWDAAGAMSAGARGALVRRPGIEANRLFPLPEIQGDDLREIARLILKRDRGDFAESVA